MFVVRFGINGENTDYYFNKIRNAKKFERYLLKIVYDDIEKNDAKIYHDLYYFTKDIQDLKNLRDRILNLKDIPVNDKTHFYLKVYTFDNGNVSKYYLYKLKDDLYYKKVNIGYGLKEIVVKDLTSLNTIISSEDIKLNVS